MKKGLLAVALTAICTMGLTGCDAWNRDTLALR